MLSGSSSCRATKASADDPGTANGPNWERLLQDLEVKTPAPEEDYQKAAPELRPSFVRFMDSTNVLIEGVHFVGSSMWTIHLLYSDNAVGATTSSSKPIRACTPTASPWIPAATCGFPIVTLTPATTASSSNPARMPTDCGSIGRPKTCPSRIAPCIMRMARSRWAVRFPAASATWWRTTSPATATADGRAHQEPARPRRRGGKRPVQQLDDGRRRQGHQRDQLLPDGRRGEDLGTNRSRSGRRCFATSPSAT